MSAMNLQLICKLLLASTSFSDNAQGMQRVISARAEGVCALAPFVWEVHIHMKGVRWILFISNIMYKNLMSASATTRLNIASPPLAMCFAKISFLLMRFING